MPRSAVPKGKALIEAIRSLPNRAFVDAMPPTSAKEWEDAELFVPISSAPATKKGRRGSKESPKTQTRSEPVKPRKRA